MATGKIVPDYNGPPQWTREGGKNVLIDPMTAQLLGPEGGGKGQPGYVYPAEVARRRKLAAERKVFTQRRMRATAGTRAKQFPIGAKGRAWSRPVNDLGVDPRAIPMPERATGGPIQAGPATSMQYTPGSPGGINGRMHGPPAPGPIHGPFLANTTGGFGNAMPTPTPTAAPRVDQTSFIKHLFGGGDDLAGQVAGSSQGAAGMADDAARSGGRIRGMASQGISRAKGLYDARQAAQLAKAEAAREAGNLGKAKGMMGKAGKAFTGVMINQQLQPMIDGSVEEDSILNDVLSGASTGMALGSFAGLKGAGVGALLGGLANGITGGNAMDALNQNEMLGGLLGDAGGGMDDQTQWLVNKSGLKPEELQQRQAGYEYMVNMGADPVAAWEQAFGGTGLAGMMAASSESEFEPDPYAQAQLMHQLVSPYTSSMLDHAASISDPALAAAYKLEAGSLATQAAMAPFYYRDRNAADEAALLAASGGGDMYSQFLAP
jgi:hypothetical protein